MSEFTPGPWKLEEPDDWSDSFRVVIDAQEERARGGVIFTVDAGTLPNLFLIAEAPALFGALSDLVIWLENSGEFLTNHGVHSSVVEAHKVLNRAVGA